VELTAGNSTFFCDAAYNQSLNSGATAFVRICNGKISSGNTKVITASSVFSAESQAVREAAGFI
jgi:hypothetical protein